LFIAPPSYYAGMVMYGIAAVVLWSCFIFVVTSLMGFYHTIRKDQDFKLIYILTTMCLFAGLHCSLVMSSFVYKPPMNCSFNLFGGTLFYPSVKTLFFIFLARKAKLVQYSANASNWVFILDYTLIGVYFVYYYTILLAPGILTFFHYTDPNDGLGICLYKTAYSTLASGSLVFEVILNVLNLYVFIKPLRAHQKETQALGNSISGHTKVLGEVITRNVKGSATSISFTIFAKILATFVLSKIPGDLGILVVSTGVTVWDETLEILCLLYLSRNAFQIKQGNVGTTNTIAGKSEARREVATQV